ncbi:uncharacterized protein [Neodiprion pinetum]|uniref:uncharacterized protein LOC124182776 n=1 Tax=Neodiprion fabricii TaxID=2872261 RepID=UPI001ED910C9|nr:uncharacterized protein LOC124182776 [Neodiprion fabricii]XP_046482918.1 uncharacterized protein LOC124219432 [Neodiprion pinetum]XP_046620238.1 uncharacterized protein LOC124305171 [Neodiprion virginianus]
MAVPFALPSEDEAEAQERRLQGLLLDVYGILQQVIRARSYQNPGQNHRVNRRSGEVPGPREPPVVLVDSDLSRLPLPDLVSSAIEQLPLPMPQVTASAPSSPTRDVAFQFPELNPSAPVPSPRPRPRRRRLVSENSALKKEQPSTSYYQAPSDENEWANVGANLRNIADDFHASKNTDSGAEKSSLPVIGNDESSPDSFLSLLIPAPLRETLWTTVALYLGWRLVSHLR